MFTRTVTRFSPPRSSPMDANRWRKLLLRWGNGLLIAASTGIALLLVAAPYYWAMVTYQEQVQAWSAKIDFNPAEAHWFAPANLTECSRGNEPEVLNYLARNPLVTAIQARIPGAPLWIRREGRLVPADSSPEAGRYRSWITQATSHQAFQWIPTADLDPDSSVTPSIVILGDRWTTVKRWVIGSPEAESAIKIIFRTNPRTRLGLRRQGVPAGHPQRMSWGAEPNLQVDPARLDDSFVESTATSVGLSGWVFVAIPFLDELGRIHTQIIRQLVIASLASLTLGGFLGMGLWLRHKVRKRALLDADRLASLTHSLKTPLAILKIRCDSIRLGRLSQDQADAELIRIGNEVDHLSLIIENGLQAIRGTQDTGPQQEVTPAWISTVAHDLEPGFQTEGRTLSLSLSPESGRATLSSLHSAILTLLENALFHGGGTVVLESKKVRKRLQIRVSDEGAGLDKHQVESLGKPFMRIRTQGKEGFQREGQGLGLSLLVQVARKEGWGLTFSSAPGEGFAATIEIQAIG